MLNLFWPKCSIGWLFIYANGQILNKQSSHLVTLIPLLNRVELNSSFAKNAIRKNIYLLQKCTRLQHYYSL